MVTSSLLPAMLAGCAVAAALAPRSGGSRLSDVLPERASPRLSGPSRLTAAPRPRPSLPLLAAVGAGAAVALLLGGLLGAVVGVAVALALPVGLARLEPRAQREQREQLAAELPLALDLLAACLAGGAAVPDAVRAVAAAVPGPCGDRLLRVAAAHDVGATASEAWSALSVGTTDELAASAARALGRAGDGGAPVAAAVLRLAEDARSAARARGEAAAERAGVLAVAPLGLCFLPAFVLLGVVPVVAGLVAPLLATF